MNNFFIDSDIDEIITKTQDIIAQLADKHIVLTGGRGFLGRYLTEIFFKYNKVLDKPIKLTVIDNLIVSGELGSVWPSYDNFKFIKSDASKQLQLGKDVDFIVHAAGIASPFYYRSKPLETLDVAVNGLRNVLNSAFENNAKVIFFSSSEIYGDPDPKCVPIKESYRGNVTTMGPRACYDEGKRLGETLCYIYKNSYNVDVNIIRPFNIYGPGMQQNDYRVLPNFASKIKSNLPLNIYGSGNQTRTYCYITDAIVGFLKVILAGVSGEAYNIGNPKPEISVMELFEIIQKILPNNIQKSKVDYPNTYPTDEPQRRCPDTSKAQNHLNFIPTVNIEDGLKRFFTWTNLNYKKEI